MKHPKFLLSPELSLDEDCGKSNNRLTANLAYLEDKENGSQSHQKNKIEGLEIALDDLRKAIEDVNKTLDHWNKNK